LIDYVNRWKRESTLLVSQVSSETDTSKPGIDSIESHSALSVDCTNQLSAAMSPHQEALKPEQGLGPTPAHDTNMIMDTIRLTHTDSQNSSSNTVPSTYSGLLWSTGEDFDLLPSFQHAVSFPDIETSGTSPLSGDFSDAIKATPVSSHDASVPVFDRFMIGEDGVPAGSVVHSQGFDLPEAESNVLTWLETNPGMIFHSRSELYAGN
jgi:hypothetical protein